MNTLAFIFPGQGSQFVGMLSELAKNFPIVGDTFAEVSNLLDYDLWTLSQQGTALDLSQTEVTQVLMLTADISVFRVIQQQLDLPPELYMAGHSLGEYSALVAANALTLTDAAKLVSLRAALMQKTVPQGLGGMAAIVGLTDEQVKLICTHASTEQEKVAPANFNAIGQVVIAGHIRPLQTALLLAEEAGARLATMIPVSVPCHCSLLKDAAEQFADILANTSIQVPANAVISNVDLSYYQSVEQIRTLLAEQLYMPVRWVETIHTLQAAGVQTFIECGPGKVLCGLIKRIDKSLTTYNVQDIASLNQVMPVIKA